MTKAAIIGGGCALALVIIALSSLLSGLIIMLLWNWIIVGVFHGPVIDYWQSVGIALTLSVLGSLIFKQRS